MPVAMNGPNAAKVSEDFARHQFRSFFCQARALTSLPQVKPRTCRMARALLTPRQRLPITTTSSPSSSTRPGPPGRSSPACGGSTIVSSGPMTALGTLRKIWGSAGDSRPCR